MKNKYLPSLVTGFGAAVLISIPFIKNIGCCVVVPFAAIYALVLHIKLNDGELPIRGTTALLFGIMTGLWAAFFSAIFETLITFFTHSNDFVQGLPAMESMLRSPRLNAALGDIIDQIVKVYHRMAADIKTYGFSLVYSATILSGNIIMDCIFGIIGGFIGMNYINKKDAKKE
jgi:hypothetical protein